MPTSLSFQLYLPYAAAPVARESRSGWAEPSASNAAVNSSTARSHARDRIAAPPSCEQRARLPPNAPGVAYSAAWGRSGRGEPSPSADVAKGEAKSECRLGKGGAKLHCR